MHARFTKNFPQNIGNQLRFDTLIKEHEKIHEKHCANDATLAHCRNYFCWMQRDIGSQGGERVRFRGTIEPYTGPQTVEALMEAFDARYSSRAANAKWATASETSYGEKRHLAFTLIDMDAKYPREEWLQMLLNKGITIETFKEYDGYFNIRSALLLKEFHTRDNWKTAKAEYIDTEIQMYQHKHKLVNEAKQAVPDIKDWTVIGENALPKIPGEFTYKKPNQGIGSCIRPAPQLNRKTER